MLELPSDDTEGMRLYEKYGTETKKELLGLLPDDFELTGKRLLDFGCGAGRTLRQFLTEADSCDVVGADIDRRSVDWINSNLNPPIEAVVSGIDPPLPFEPDSFDLAWAISVFTHLSSNSAEWLLELHRVLKPGGLLMASYMGEWNSEEIAGEPWDPDRIGMNRLFHNRPWDEGGPMILMSDWWVEEHWGRAFEIVGRNPWVHNQTWVMLRKKDVDLAAEDLLAPSDDPREWVAINHNLTQLQRELESTPADLGAAVQLQAEFERSLSWRITRPLRAIANLFRRSG